VGSAFDISQLEAYVSLIGEELGITSLEQTGLDVGDERAAAERDAVVRCAGDDEWVAATLPDAAAHRILAALGDAEGGTPGRALARLEDYAATRTKHAVAELLQGLGVAAFPVETTRDLVDDPHLQARGSFVDVSSEGAQGRLPGSPIRSPERALTSFRRPAPSAGEHTIEILRDELQLDEDEIDELLRSKAVVQFRDD
jgi:crotonobetainyl-CoA:carnitine CoA-transferase CaiB-like acyl-CoA transferase